MKRVVFRMGAVAATIGSLVACGGTGGSGSTDGAGGGSGSTNTTGAGAGSASSSAGAGGGATACNTSANIVGSWEFVNDGTAGVIGIYTFNSGGTYSLGLFANTGTAAFDEEEETGTYTVSGDVLTLTPTDSTCPAADPAHVLGCFRADGDLVLQVPGDSAGLWVSGKAPTGTISTGCVVNDEWVPSPLMPE
jgi:hypothetical protein